MPYVEIDDIRMYYEEAGRGEPLLLLHGALGAVGPGIQSGWSALQPALATRYHTIALEHRGHGRTCNPGSSLSYARIVADLAAAIEGLGLGPVHIAGASLGGEAGLALALTRPTLVRSLVCVGANYHIDDEARAALELFDAVALERDLPDFAQMLAARHDPHHHPGYWRELVEQIRALAEPGLGIGEDGLRRITAPVLLVSGEADEFNGMKQALEMRRLIPNSELLILNHAGLNGLDNHRVQHTRSDVVCPVVLDFLDRHRAAATVAAA